MVASNTPLVTVYMCVYNAASYLEEAVGSVLTQSFSDFEFVIIDDGSTDGSRRILESYDDPRIRLVVRDHEGIVKSRNAALQAARGEYVAVQDADDISVQRRLATQVEFLDKHPEIVLVGTGFGLIDLKGRFIRDYVPPTDQDVLLERLLRMHNPIPHSSCMFRRRPVLGLGGYDELFRKAHDYALILHLARRRAVATIPERYVWLRSLVDSATFADAEGEQLKYALLARALELSVVSQLRESANGTRWGMFYSDFEAWYRTSASRRRFLAGRFRRGARLEWSRRRMIRALGFMAAALRTDPIWPLSVFLGSAQGYWSRQVEDQVLRIARRTVETSVGSSVAP